MFPLHGLLSRPIKVLCVWTRIGAYVLRLSAACGLDLEALETGQSLSTAYAIVEGGGTNPCDVGLDLSGSWQQGHSATYNAPSRI